MTISGQGGQEMNEQPPTRVLELDIADFLIKIQVEIKENKL